MAVRAVRGATQLDDDVREHMLERVAEMVLDVMAVNGLAVDDFISVIFTATSDLVSEFPAYAARRLGFGDVPLICARELEIEGSMPRVVRMRGTSPKPSRRAAYAGNSETRSEVAVKITEMKSSTTRPLDSITSSTISATRSSMCSRTSSSSWVAPRTARTATKRLASVESGVTGPP